MEAKGEPRAGARTPDVTRLLREAGQGDEDALERLAPFVYEELRRLARRHLRRERGGHTLQATALAHEAFLELVVLERIAWRDRAHFFAVAATCMRRLLVDHARRRRAVKRGGRAEALALEQVELAAADGPGELVDVLDLNDALERLGRRDARKVRALELRYFGGLENVEIADLLGVSLGTVERDLRLARAWLQRELSRGGG